MIAARTEDGICTLTIDRTDSANALTAAMLEELGDRVLAALEDPGARVLVLTGAGHVFSAGAELDEVRNHGLATSPLWERLSGAVAAFGPLSIAALNGTVAGGAMGMVLACDLRIAVPEARFFYPVLKIGVRPQPSDPGRMRALIGPARTKMILMGGQKIAAPEALAWGLVDRIVPRDEMSAAIASLATDALATDPVVAANLRAML